MKGRYKYRKNRKISLNWILMFILLMTVVYAAISSTLYINGGGIVKAMPNSDYYYMNGYFYSSPEGARANQGRIADKSVVDETVDLTSMNQAISQIHEGKKIYMMSTYEVSSEEAITVANKNMEILRYKVAITDLDGSNFANGSLFSIKSKGKLTITVEDTATLAIDGQNVEVASGTDGAAFSGEINSALILENKAGITDAFQIRNNMQNDGDGGGIFTHGYLKAYKIDISENKLVGMGEGAGISLHTSSSADIENCNITSNTIVSNSNRDPKGAGIFIWESSNVNIIDCNISGNEIINNVSGRLALGVGVCVRGNLTGNITIRNTAINENTATGIAGARTAGIGAYLDNYNNTINFESCIISDNTSDLEQSFGGGLYCTGNGTKNIRKAADSEEEFGCVISNNSAQYCSGLYTWHGTNVMEDCKLSGNEINDTRGTNKMGTQGGAEFPTQIYVSGDSKSSYLIGNTKIESGDSSDYGIWFDGNGDLHGTLALSKDSKNFSLSGEKIKIACSGNKPTSTTPVIFATSASENMLDYFEPMDDYATDYSDGNLKLVVKDYKNLYYNSGSFYSDEDCTQDTGITTFSDAVNKIISYSDTSKGKIYMKSTYNPASDETVNIPANKTVFVQRHLSFNNASMFSLNSSTGNLTINATNTDSKLIVDGANIETGSVDGAAFFNWGKTLTLNGGTGNITIQNNVCSVSGNRGGAVENTTGTSNLTGCIMTGNKASYGGAIVRYKGEMILKDCTITGNTAYYGGGGLLVYSYSGNISLQGKMIISDNTVNSGVNKDMNIEGDYTVDVSGLTYGSNIGISFNSIPSNSYRTFGTNASYESMLYFISTMDGYGVTYYNGNLVLAPKINKGTNNLDISPTGYTIEGSSEVAYKGPIILTNNSQEVAGNGIVFKNESGTEVTYDITFENYKGVPNIWSSNIRTATGTSSPITVNMISSKGDNYIKGYNHAAIVNDSTPASNYKFNLKVVSGSMLLGNTYDSAEPRVYRDVVFSFLNNPTLSFDANKNTTFRADGTISQ